MKLPFNSYWCYAILAMATVLSYQVSYRNGKVFFDNGRETFFFWDKDPVEIANYLKKEGGFKRFPENGKTERRHFTTRTKKSEHVIISTRHYTNA